MSGYLVNLHVQTKENIKKNVLSLCEDTPSGNLVDCGCYNGIFTNQIAHIVGAKRVVGLDIIEETLAMPN